MEVCSSSSSMWGTIPQCSGALATPNEAGAAGAMALMSAAAIVDDDGKLENVRLCVRILLCACFYYVCPSCEHHMMR